MELKAFRTSSGKIIHQFDSLYEDEADEAFVPANATVSAEDRLTRRQRRAISDTIIVPARKEGFERQFLGQSQWYAIRIGAARRDRLKYIAAYQVAPVSAVTHIAEIEEIKPYEDTGKYLVIFKGKAEKIGPGPCERRCEVASGTGVRPSGGSAGCGDR